MRYLVADNVMEKPKQTSFTTPQNAGIRKEKGARNSRMV